MSEAAAFVVRTVARGEVQDVHDLWLAADDSAAWTPASDGAQLMAELDVLCAEDRVWAAFHRRKPVAFAAAGELDGALWLSALGVASDYRGRGLARALVSAVIGYAGWAYYPTIVTLSRSDQDAFFTRFEFLRLDPRRLGGSTAILANARGLEARVRRL